MLKCFNKIITGVLAVSCLSVAAVNVRLMMSTSHSQTFTIPSINLTSKIAQNHISIVEKFETKLAEISFAPETTVAKKVAVKKAPAVKVAAQTELTAMELAPQLINFDEPVKLVATKIEYSLPTKLVALLPAFNFAEKVMIAEVKEVENTMKEDSVSSVMAAAEISEEEPVFFDYPVEATSAEVSVEKIVDNSKASHKALTKADYEQMADEFISFDYSAAEASAPAQKVNKQVSSTTFSNQPVAPKSSKVPAQASALKSPAAAPKVTTQNVTTQQEEVKSEVNTFASLKSNALPVMMSIQGVGTNFRKVQNVKNFEVRFQDDLSEIYEDYGSGEVTLSTRVSAVMNRSMVLLKRGYAPTNTDLIIENNSKVTLPLIDEHVFNTLLDKVESSSAVGALLVELDDDTDAALLDAEYSEEVLLDQHLKTATDENYRYKLFVGLKAGNVYLTYKQFDGSETSKIVHIHEREITFDANLYEEVKHSQVAIYEEGLLSKELSPLIVTGEQVRVFATELIAKKMNQNTYKFNHKKSLLGDRQYLEINHLDEPVFVGYRDTNKLVVPSENFINFVLAKFEDKKLGNRCIIQVNIDAPVANFFVGTESTASNLVTSSQVLDQDGKFYDSVGPKSNKIIILGENYGSLEQGQDGKVNIKLDYLDGSSRFITSYCSPNTYLVEQL